MDIALRGIYQGESNSDGTQELHVKTFNDPHDTFMKIDEILTQNGCEINSEWKQDEFTLRPEVRYPFTGSGFAEDK